MSQAELAYHHQLCAHSGKGRKCNPSAGLLCKLAIALGVPMETFMQTQPEENDDFYYEREERRTLI